MMGETGDGRRETEDLEERFEANLDHRGEKWDEFEDNRVGTSRRASERGDERVGRRGNRDPGKAGGSGDRTDKLKENSSEQPSKGRKKGGHRNVDSVWDESEEGKVNRRGKRGREDDRRDSSRGKDRGDGTQEDSDGETKPSGRRRGEDSRGYRPQTRNGGVEDWGELEGGSRSTGRLRSERTDEDSVGRSRARDKAEAGWEESEESGRFSGRGRAERGEDGDWVEKLPSGGREMSADVAEEGARFGGRGRGEQELLKGDKQRDNFARDRTTEMADNAGRSMGRSRANEERHEKLKSRDRLDGGRDEPDDGGRSGGRSRGGKSVKERWSPDGRRGRHGDWDDSGRDWVDDEFMGGSGDADWDGPIHQDRGRLAEGGFIDARERHIAEDEPPPGLDQGFGPGPGRGGGNDGGIGFNMHGGRGRTKGSPSNRSRGPMIPHESRPNFGNNQGGGLMMRGGGKGGRGGRGTAKVGRGGGRDGQRGNVAVLPQMGPGLPGPHFGQLGPPGPIAGLGPGIMGPGAFPLPPFGGRMGWNGGDMGMMAGPPGPGPVPGPPRFVPGMGPGPPGLGPNMFFGSPGHVRGGPGGIVPGGMFTGNLPFGSRPMPGDRGPPGGRGIARGGGPAGRGPSRGEQNDYSQHFVDTGQRPQNFIRDVELADRFEEYPKLKELIARKDKLIAERATPPMYMQCDLKTTELRPEIFGTKFDVILVDPPWEEYVRRAPGVGDAMEWWSYTDIQSLRIEAISDTPAFIFLWVGDSEGLDQGRLCLKKWGFRRCEDICWVKTNRENPTPALRHDANTVLQHSKEHCLMGIKGTVRRSTDGHIIHANVDTDIIISEEPDYGSTAKPEELYHIIEHFAQGQRRIELFGEDHNIRAGWVTVGKGLSSSNFSPQTYAKHFLDSEGKVWQGGRGNPPFDAPHLVGTTSEIESLRPKSPPPRAQQQPQSQAANSGQPSGTLATCKRTSSGLQSGSQTGLLVPSLSPGVGHGALNPVEVGPGSASRGGSYSQNMKPVETTVAHDLKSSGFHLGSDSDKVVTEEPGFGPDMLEPSGELPLKADPLKPVVF